MTDHPNAKLLRKGYEAFASGDMATITELFSEDVVWHAPGNNPVSGVHRGRDAVFAALAKVTQLSEGQLQDRAARRAGQRRARGGADTDDREPPRQAANLAGGNRISRK